MMEDGSITVEFPQEPDKQSEEVPYEEGATIAEINDVIGQNNWLSVRANIRTLSMETCAIFSPIYMGGCLGKKYRLFSADGTKLNNDEVIGGEDAVLEDNAVIYAKDKQAILQEAMIARIQKMVDYARKNRVGLAKLFHRSTR